MAEGYFQAGDLNDPRVNQALRQRIALQLMLGKGKGYPKNIGEGLSAIGEAIGDRGLARMLEQSDIAAQGVEPPAAAAVAPAQKVSYAPADMQDEPAVKAINTAILQKPGPVSDQPPPQEGGYNAIDAQAGFPASRTTPGYIQDAIARQETNPDMQAYYGSLVAAEAPKGPRDTSSTGAAGPYQFTRGTGRQYGLIGRGGVDQREDLDASTAAVQKFTQDNADTFQRINGRPPTMAELAVMHQQGGVTGANMIAGIGNAPPANLAVNNINPQAGPQQAVAAIKNYYGMPDRPVDPRAMIASTLVQQQPQAPVPAQAVPQPNPTLAGAPQLPSSSTIPSAVSSSLSPDLRLAQDTSQSASDISAAPRVSEIRQAPPMGQPVPTPGYVPPEPGKPTPAPLVPMTPREIQLNQWLAANQGNPYAAMKVAPELQTLQAERTQRQNEANEQFKAEIARATEQAKLRQQALMDQAKRIADIEEAKARTQKERLIDPYEKQYVLGPDNVARPLAIQGRSADTMPQVKLTEPQSKALVFHDWARLGNEGMQGREELLAKGLQQEMLGKVPFAGNALQSAEYRRARNAANNFVLAFMRDTSGAAYGAKEMYDHASAMLPKLGDDAKTLADKAAQRSAFINNLYGSLGPGREIADFSIRKQKETEQARQQAIDAEMQTHVPKGIGDTKINLKTGAKRVWNGKNWVEM
jgi:hypothetical protein